MNTDGLHFDGPANDITISDCDFTMADDAIALNCPEGYTGNITRVSVTRCTFKSLTLMRLYTTNGGTDFSIDTVTVNHCVGTLSGSGFVMGYFANSGVLNPITALTVSNCVLTVSALLEAGENFGTIEFDNVIYIPSRSDQICGLLRPSPHYNGMTHGSSLTFNNCSIYRKSSMKVGGVILGNGSTIDNLVFNGFAVQDAGSYSPMLALIDVGAGTVGQLVLDSVNGTNVQVPIVMDRFASVGSVSGTGVLATGWKFADAIMANGVPYISANSDRPSIKVGGVVEPYSNP